MKKFYQEATGISSGAGLMAVRVAAGRTDSHQGGRRYRRPETAATVGQMAVA